MTEPIYVTYLPPLTYDETIARRDDVVARQLVYVLDEIAAGRSVGVFADSPIVRAALRRAA